MSLIQLNIHNLRNIESASYENLHPRFNIFQGPNGSGKTSILEAIYLLSCGHSFRTREISPLIRHHQPTMTVFARTSSNESVSIQKTSAGQTHVKINQEICVKTSELARFLPSQVFYQDLFQIMDAGPNTRRGLLDWGLFHVKQSYHEIWKNYRHVLKQRNALLRQRAPLSQFKPWDDLFVDLAEKLHQMREHYFSEWSTLFKNTLSSLTSLKCSLEYYRGWDKRNSGKPLHDILIEQFSSDLQHQYTHSGAHQADILFNHTTQKAKHILSRGQQKIILIALKLAQAQLLNKPCIYLLDDITAELDTSHIENLFNYLKQMDGQFFITCIQNDFIGLENCSNFYSILVANEFSVF
jgi:DNA replication and repair protein RecF